MNKIDDDDSRIRKTSTRADYYIARPITKLNCTIINTPKRRSKGILLLTTYVVSSSFLSLILASANQDRLA